MNRSTIEADRDTTPFLFEGETLVRAVMKDTAPWFVAADVCRVLGLSNPSKAVEGLDADEVAIHTLTVGEGTSGNPNVNIISESGLYALIFRSRKPAAIRFRKWITAEVIPALRRTGVYAVPGTEQPTAAVPDTLPTLGEFPNWPLDEWTLRLRTIDRYERLYGKLAAQWLMPRLGFPVPPPALIQAPRQLDMLAGVLAPTAGCEVRP